MSSSAPAARLTAARPGRRDGALRRLTITEFKLFARERVGLFWGVGFPLGLLIIFGAIPGFRGPVSKATPHVSILDAYVPILIAFVLALLALNVLPTSLATYRERGVLRRLATTPVGPGRMLGAQLIICVGMTVAMVAALLALGRIAYSVPLPRQLAGFAAAAVLTTLALVSIGLFFAAVARTTKAATAMGAIALFPMMFFAGLWLPIAAMPALLQHISHVTPLGAGVQAMTDAWQGQWPGALNLITLAIYAVVLGAGAARLFRWE